MERTSMQDPDGLFGAYPLTAQDIDRVVSGRGPGVYELGKLSKDGRTFYVYYVGRSDADLNHRLKDHLGSYLAFKYASLPSTRDAFVSECRLYHRYKPADTDAHPSRPAGTKWKCPECSALGE